MAKSLDKILKGVQGTINDLEGCIKKNIQKVIAKGAEEERAKAAKLEAEQEAQLAGKIKRKFEALISGEE